MTHRSDFAFFHPLRVRWAECDAQGIVFNVNYFLYFDVAMTEWMRALGYEGASTIEFFTVNAQADFRGSAVFDDMIEIGARCSRLGTKSMTVTLAIYRGEELLTEGLLTYAHADHVTKKTAPLNEEFVQRVIAFEKTTPERKAAAL